MQTARFLKSTFGWLSWLFIGGSLLMGIPMAMLMDPPAVGFAFLTAILVVLLIGIVMAIGSAILTVLLSIERRLNP